MTDPDRRGRLARIAGRLIRSARKPKKHSEERRCPECDARLNRYNPGPFCYVHRPFQKPRIRGRSVSSDEEQR